MVSDAIQKRNHLLIIEDKDGLLAMMPHISEEEFTVSTADNNSAAWESVCMRMPDLVVSEIMLPCLDGFEFCRLMKSTGKTEHIPVILVTALADKGKQLHAFYLGADDYLIKPFDMDILLQRIRSIIKNREVISERALRQFMLNNEIALEDKLNNKFLKKAAEVVRTQISNPDFDKNQFASAMHVSSSLLYKKIKAITHLSPVNYIKAVRLVHALGLLQTRKYTVIEVSELCGFSSIGYFSMVFKKYFGKPPSSLL